LPDAMRRWAVVMSERILPHVGNWSSMRAHAILLKAIEQWQGKTGDAGRLRDLTSYHACALHSGYRRHGTGLHWFEDTLSYDNARLPEGLLIAGFTLGDKALQDGALEALRFIMARQT